MNKIVENNNGLQTILFHNHVDENESEQYSIEE
jgi:hypothetical protein